MFKTSKAVIAVDEFQRYTFVKCIAQQLLLVLAKVRACTLHLN